MEGNSNSAAVVTKPIKPVSSLVEKFEHIAEPTTNSPGPVPTCILPSTSNPPCQSSYVSFSQLSIQSPVDSPPASPTCSVEDSVPSQLSNEKESCLDGSNRAMEEEREIQISSAAEAFKAFTEAQELEETLTTFERLRKICTCDDGEPNEVLHSEAGISIPKLHGRELYLRIKNKVTNNGTKMTQGAELWKALDHKLAREEYGSAPLDTGAPSTTTPCEGINLLVVGSGPAGLRTAIEAEFLGARSLVIEKRTSFSRNNALHLWPFSIQDLKSLGAKFFFGKFCAGLINHVAVKRLQLILLKCALICGVQVLAGIEFKDFAQSSSSGKWEAIVLQQSGEHVQEIQLPYPFDVLIGADGEKSHVATLSGFERKTFQGGTAIGITANFQNHQTREETALDEFGLLNVYNRAFFDDLEKRTGLQLENLVMYHDETHYFVMTPKKESLIEKGVFRRTESLDTHELLMRDNIDREKLKQVAREVAEFCHLPSSCEFASSGSGDEDVEIFDFSRKQQALDPVKLISPASASLSPLLVILVGDSLIEPFWPQGTGANRALLSALDAAWTIKSMADERKRSGIMTVVPQNMEETEKEVLQVERGAYKLLQTATPEDLKLGEHGIDPSTRYKGFSSVKTTVCMR